jgi:hypothetical protein
MTMPRVGSRWTRASDAKVYVVTLSQRNSLFGTGPKVILVEEVTGYPRIHTTPSGMKKTFTEVKGAR